MHRYEVLILTIPEITSDETATLEKEFEKTLKQEGGALISFERWGKLRLAYPVNKSDYGVYFLTRFEVEEPKKQALLDALKSFFAVKYNNLVMRHMVCAFDPEASLAYERPESLEDTPARDVGKFLRENKMEGLLTKVGTEENASEESEAAQTTVSQETVASEALEAKGSLTDQSIEVQGV